MGVPTDLPHENRVSQFAKNTAKQSVAATNRREEGFDIPKSRKKIVSYTDLVSYLPSSRQALAALQPAPQNYGATYFFSRKDAEPQRNSKVFH